MTAAAFPAIALFVSIAGGLGLYFYDQWRRQKEAEADKWWTEKMEPNLRAGNVPEHQYRDEDIVTPDDWRKWGSKT